jgi:hypothetical protein
MDSNKMSAILSYCSESFCDVFVSVVDHVISNTCTSPHCTKLHHCPPVDKTWLVFWFLPRRTIFSLFKTDCWIFRLGGTLCTTPTVPRRSHGASCAKGGLFSVLFLYASVFLWFLIAWICRKCNPWTPGVYPLIHGLILAGARKGVSLSIIFIVCSHVNCGCYLPWYAESALQLAEEHPSIHHESHEIWTHFSVLIVAWYVLNFNKNASSIPISSSIGRPLVLSFSTRSKLHTHSTASHWHLMSESSHNRNPSGKNQHKPIRKSLLCYPVLIISNQELLQSECHHTWKPGNFKFYHLTKTADLPDWLRVGAIGQ